MNKRGRKAGIGKVGEGVQIVFVIYAVAVGVANRVLCVFAELVERQRVEV